MDTMAKSTRAKKRRAVLACVFCRKRKIKCNAQQPCNNCLTYEKECTFSKAPPSGGLRSNLPGPPTPRPSAVSSSPRSREGTVSRAGVSEEASLARIRDASISLTTEEEEVEVVHQPPPPVPNGQTGHDKIRPTNYYGPTSAHFEDPSSLSVNSRSATTRWVTPPEIVEKLLLAEAAHQRQMEDINYAAGKLDFDGVDPDLGYHLLSLHWNRQHHSFLLTHRPSFMRDMACGGRHFSKLLLNAIYFGASKFSPRLCVRRDPDDVRTAGWQFRQRVKELLAGALDKSEVTTIQALLVMTNSLFALGDERSAAWLYAGLAFRMIVDLGIHVDAPVASAHGAWGLTDEDVEIRRRVFWGAFVVDKIQSLYQGRPPSLQEIDARVSLIFSDKYEELEAWSPFAFNQDTATTYRSGPAYSVSTFTELCKLCLIMNHILNKVYAEKNVRKPSTNLAQDRLELQQELDMWSQALPNHLTYRSIIKDNVPPPHCVSLQAMYNVLLILLNRPFVSEGVAAEAFPICATAAIRINNLLSAYDHAFSIKRAPYLISYATYVAATIHVRIAAQQEPGSEAHLNLQQCLAVLSKNQETNWAVRKARKVIVELSERMNVRLDPENDDVAEIALDSTINYGQRPNAMSDVSPIDTISTHVNDQIFDKLDLEAIIHSFMQEQGDSRNSAQSGTGIQNGINGYSITYHQPSDTIHASSLASNERHHNPRRISNTGDPEQLSMRGETELVGWNMTTVPHEDDVADHTITEDALYGFNRHGLDTWWA